MGLFNNYDKPGKGIDKDAPKKKGIFLYFELLWRKLGLLVKSNMLYFLVSIPVILIYHFASWFVLTNLTRSGNPSQHFILISAILLTILWGTGPVSCGYAYLMRNFAREEHVFLTSDFFEKIKENFKLGNAMLAADIVVLFTGTIALRFYMQLFKSGHAFAKYIICILIIAAMFYTFMHYYVYEFAVTFENKVGATIKNSLIMSAATLPMNLLLTIFITFITYLVFGFFTPIAIVFLSLFFWISLMRFPIDFYVARVIKRKLIK